MGFVPTTRNILRSLASALAAITGLAGSSPAYELTERTVMVASWMPNPETDISSYILHLGRHPDSLSERFDAGNATRFELTDLVPGTTYYCAISAVNTSGMSGPRSEVASFVVPTGFPPPTDAESWLIAHGFETGLPMTSDPDRDGVPLLTAYAFHLNPHDRPQAGIPRAVIRDGRLHIRFFAGRNDVTYRAEASADLVSWSDANVALTPRDHLHFRTASIVLGGNERFLRLVVSR